MITQETEKEIFEKATLLYDQKAIEQAIDTMAAQITEKIAAESPLVLTVMTGGLHITAALTLRLQFPLEIDYAHATRYLGELRPGDLHWRVEPRLQLKDRVILIVDDILDGGLTLGAIHDYCTSRGAKAVYTAVLIDKNHPREPGGLEKADFTGLKVEDRFLFGYGLDYNEYFRNIPAIYAVEGFKSQ